MKKTEKNQADFSKTWAKIIKRCTTDEAFKKKLLSQPEQVLKEMGIAIPAGKTIKIVEETQKTHYLVLPDLQAIKNLSEEELRKVSGGTKMDAATAEQYYQLPIRDGDTPGAYRPPEVR